LPAPTCGSYSGSDVWFWFTVPATGTVTLDSDVGVITDGAMNAYSGSCGTLANIECDDDDSGNGAMPMLELTGLTPSEVIYIRFWEYGGNNNGTFDICAYDPTPLAPPVCTTPVSPLDAAIDVAADGTLSWDASTGADGYLLYFGTDGGGTVDPINIVPGTDQGDVLTYAYSGLAFSTVHYWKVVPWNAVGPATGCPIWSFTTEAFVMTVPATGNNSYTVCTGNLYDAGGPTGDYPINCDGYTVLYPDIAGNLIEIFGTQDTESGYDGIEIYDGVGLGGTLLYAFEGTQAIPTLTSSDLIDGALTVYFYSDGSVTYSGFEITIACVLPPDCPGPTNLQHSNVTQTEADLSWDFPAESFFDVYVDLGSGPPGPGTVPTESGILGGPRTTKKNRTGGSPGTSYDWYVRNDCGFTAPKVDYYWMAMNAPGNLLSPPLSGGTYDLGLGETGEWYEYYDAPGPIDWWNIWFYNEDFDDTRMKKIKMGFWIQSYDGINPGELYYVVNWSNDSYPNGTGTFPTPAQEIWIDRSPTNGPVPVSIGAEWIELSFIIEDYNPEWVSIDLWGENIQILESDIDPLALQPPSDSPLFDFWVPDSPGGIIVHECLPKPLGNNSDWSGPNNFTTSTPGNDCTDPIVVTLPADLDYLDAGQTTCGRGNNYDATCLGYYDSGEDIIYEITVTSDVVVNIDLEPNGTTYTGILIDYACPGGSTCIDYSTNSGSSAHGLTGVALQAAVGTYYIMVDTWAAPDCIPDFDLTITTAASPPANDDCSGAIALSVDCECTPITATNVAATDSGETPGCANYQGGDVWFSAVVPANGYLVVESAVNGGFTDGGMAAWTGTCAGLTLYECDDDDGPGLMPMIEIDDMGLAGQTLYFSVWEYGNDTYGDFDICAHTSPLDATWTGTINNDWHDAGNWNTVCYPGVRTNVTIPAGLGTYPTISAAATCNNILFGSTAAGDASLLDGGFLTIYGTTTVERYATASTYHGFSPSVSGETSGMFHFGGSTGYDVYLMEHNEAANSYSDIIPTNVLLNTLQGYFIWGDGANATPPVGNWTYEMNGAFNTGPFGAADNIFNTNGDFTTGWNFLGNPYTSALDWQSAYTASGANVDATVYCYRGDLSQWATWNQGAGGNNGGAQFIAMGQGFFVHVTAAGPGTFIVDNTDRVHNGVAFMKSEIANKLSLQVANAEFTDETVIVFNENATVSFDSEFDAYKLESPADNVPAFYSIATEHLAVNVLPSADWVQLGFHAGVNGEYTISANEIIDIPSVTLEDTFTGTLTDLTSDSYTFVYNTNDNANRFIVHFSPLSTPDNAADLYNIYSYDKDIYVAVPEDTKGHIIVYDMIGHEVAEAPINSVLNVISLEKSAYYIVKVMSDENVITKKVFIK